MIADDSRTRANYIRNMKEKREIYHKNNIKFIINIPTQPRKPELDIRLRFSVCVS